MTDLEKLMKNLDLTEEEARQLMADDKAIDKGEKLFELTAEQKKVAKSMTITAKSTKNASKVRKKAENPVKKDLINALFEYLPQILCENVEIVNELREIAFTKGEKSYSLTLVEHRTAKK